MCFFRLIILVVVMLVQPVFVLAEVVEVDVLDTPVAAHAVVLPPGQTIVAPVFNSHMHDPSFDLIEKTFPTKAYVLGAGDIIEIKVFGQDDLSLTTRLDASGVISYQYIGKIQAVGLTTLELEHSIVKGLKNGYFVSPHVNVSIVEYRPFYIKGQVKNPGPYPYQPGLTLAKAIAIAGGHSEFASEDDVFILREGKSADQMRKIISSDMIYPGDTVTIKDSVFYVDGAVKKPGKYPLKSGLTVREAIALAGGLTERGSTSKIHIKTSQRGMVSIDLDDEIKPGSSIVVMESYF